MTAKNAVQFTLLALALASLVMGVGWAVRAGSEAVRAGRRAELENWAAKKLPPSAVILDTYTHECGDWSGTMRGLVHVRLPAGDLPKLLKLNQLERRLARDPSLLTSTFAELKHRCPPGWGIRRTATSVVTDDGNPLWREYTAGIFVEQNDATGVLVCIWHFGCLF